MNARLLIIVSAVFLSFALIVLYYYHAYKISPSVEIIHTSVEDFDPSSMLTQRCPILFRESFVRPREACERLMKYYHWRTSAATLSSDDSPQKVDSYVLACYFQGETSSGIVKLSHPRSSAAELDVALRGDQVLLVPRAWSLSVPSDDLSEFDSDDRLQTISFRGIIV